MNLRKIITILIIVAALVVAGIFAYKTFANPAPKTTTKPTAATQGAAAVTGGVTPKADGAAGAKTTTGVASILPLGTKLDFELVKKFNPTGRLFPYPSVRSEEAGLTLNEIVTQ